MLQMEWINVRDQFPPTKTLLLLGWFSIDYSEAQPFRKFRWWPARVSRPYDDDQKQFNPNYYYYNLISYHDCPKSEELEDEMYWCLPSIEQLKYENEE